MEAVWDYGMLGRASVFFDFFWAIVSEKYLKVYRILLDDHHVSEFFDPYICHDSGVGEYETDWDCIDGVVW